MKSHCCKQHHLCCVCYIKVKKKSQHISLFFFTLYWTVNSSSHISLLQGTIYLFLWSDILCEVQYVCVFGPHQQLRPVQKSAAKSPTMWTSSTLTVCVSSFAAEQEVCRVIVWAFWGFFLNYCSLFYHKSGESCRQGRSWSFNSGQIKRWRHFPDHHKWIRKAELPECSCTSREGRDEINNLFIF